MFEGKILIVGYGVVGNNMRKLLEPHCKNAVYIHDPAKGYTHTEPVDIAFICVPTDTREDGSADTSIVEKVCAEIKANVIVIKSTVPPGTCQLIAENANNIVFSPEYFGGTQHANAINNDFVILAGDTDHGLNIVAELYKHIFDGRGRIIKTDWKTAELVKYMENAFFATKVSFVNEFAQYAEHIGIDRDELRELWLLDDRIGRSHTFSYRDAPFYDSHCLNKDIPAIIKQAEIDGAGLPLLAEVSRLNVIRRGIVGFYKTQNAGTKEPTKLERDAEDFISAVNCYGNGWCAAKSKRGDNKYIEILVNKKKENSTTTLLGNVWLNEYKGANIENVHTEMRETLLATLRALGYERTYV